MVEIVSKVELAGPRKPIRVCIAQAVKGHQSHIAVQSQFEAFHYAVREGITEGLTFSNDTYLDKARNTCVIQAFEMDATHIVWIDADMVTPMDTVTRLVAHGLQCVGGLYFKRGKPYAPVIYDFDSPTPDVADSAIGFQTARYIKEDNALYQVGGLGMGCTLTTMDIFRRMPEPWFACLYEYEGQKQFVGEDIYFFHKLYQMNIPVWVDTSLKCGHVTDYVVDYDLYKTYEDYQEVSDDGPAS